MDPFNTNLRKLQEAWENMNHLEELIDVGDGNYVIAYKSKVWRFNDDSELDDEETERLQNFFDTIGVELEADNFDSYWFGDVSQEIEEENRHDIVFAHLQDSSLQIYKSGSFQLDPKSSVQIKKLAKHLGANRVTYSDMEDEFETFGDDISGDIPDAAFHGTSSEYFINLLRIGLRPRVDTDAQGNYDKQGIGHYEDIFFTTRFDEAHGHATHTAVNAGGVPIVLEFRIPDKNKIIPDYDVETMSNIDVTSYQHIDPSVHSRVKKGPLKPERLAKEVGIYGYKGAIPPKFFTAVYVGREVEIYGMDDYQKFDIAADGKKAAGEAIEYIKQVTDDYDTENPYAKYVYGVAIEGAVDDLEERVQEDLQEKIDELKDDDYEPTSEDIAEIKLELAQEKSYEYAEYYEVPENLVLDAWMKKYHEY